MKRIDISSMLGG